MPLSPASTSASDTNAFRLPRTATPERYRIEIEPNVATSSFSGSVTIDIVVNEAVDHLVLNAAGLAVSDVEVTLEDGSLVVCAVEFNDDMEQVTFRAPSALPPGPCSVACRFSGAFNEQLRGIYRSTFTDEAGETHALATTQFESVDARRAFPCWDEPDRKATFELTLTVDADAEAFSNSPIVEVTPAGDMKRVHFSPTMKMSTYLVAFVVGTLETTETVDVDGVPLRVVFTPGKRPLADFALEIGAFALRFFTEYFNIPYPGEKVDLVAIPDFAAGAMENLGCITFRDTALLVDPATAARAELERVADVVAHELAHMWFGDLVTMGWWEGIWLNEAFATFMEVLCVDAFRPAWQRWIGFTPTLEAAMAIDGVHATRPIEYPVGPPKEAEGMFDLLTYEKGCGVLRMLEQHIGAEVFRDGVRNYLKAHAYANTVTTDLWDALEEASGEPVRDVANTFILQGGHPLVSLDGTTLRQQPFSFGPVPEGTESAIGDTWNVPVAVRALAVDGQPGAPVRNLVLRTDPVEVPEAAQGLAVVNADGWGIFRVGYSAAHRLALAEHLSELTPTERAHLVADTWATTLAGHSSLEEFLVLAAKLGLELEPDPTAWTPVASALALCSRITAEADRADFEAAVAALVGPVHAHLGFDAMAGEGERTPTLRSMAINLLGTIGADEGVRAEAARRFDASPMGGGNGSPIPADVATATLAALAYLVRPGDYDTLLESSRTAPTAQEELRALHTLAAFPDIALAERTFDLSLSEIRTQNGWIVIAGLLNNPVAGQAIWRRMTESWDLMLERFPKNAATRMIEPIAGLCGDPGFAHGVVGFLREHPLASGPRRVLQSIERLEVNVAFGAREVSQLGQAYRAAVAAAKG